MSTTTTENSSSTKGNFEEIKGQVLAFIEQRQSNSSKAATTNATEGGSSNVNMDQLNILLEKVTSFVNKQDHNKSQQGSTTSSTTKKQSDDAEDLQSKLTAFLQSLSNGNVQALSSSSAAKDTSSSPSESSTGTTNGNASASDPTNEIVEKLKQTIADFTAKKDNSKQATGNNSQDGTAEKSNPAEAFFAFIQGLMNKDASSEGSKNGGAKTSPDIGALCGAFF